MASDSNARKLATWHAIVITLDVSIATIMDTLQQIALTKYLLQACQHGTEITPLVCMTGQHLRTATPGILTMTIETDTDLADCVLTHITPDIGVTAIVIPTEAILDHFIDLHTIAPCITEVSAHTTITVTHHITDPHHADISPEKTVDPEHIDSSRQHYKPTQRSSSKFTVNALWKPKDRRHKQVTIDDPPSEYYSSDEQDSDSEDDLN